MKKIFFGLFFALIAISIITPSSAFAAPTMSETLDAVKNIYTFDGGIYSAVTDGETLYLGGGFSNVTRENGEAMLFDEVTEEVQTFPKITTEENPNDTVYSVISDGDGGWYVGGSFTHVDDEERPALIHVLADGSVDENFDASLVIYDTTIYALSLSPDGNTLYIGGSFTQVDGEPRTDIAALDATTGALLPLDFDLTFYCPDTIYALDISSTGDVLYAAGDCMNIEGVYSNIAALDTETGVATSLGISTGGPQVYALQLSSDDATLYFGGSFSGMFDTIPEFTPVDQGYIGAIDVETLELTGFDPELDGTVRALLLSGDDQTLYVGGSFANVGVTPRNEFAAIDTETGLATELDAGVSGGNNTVLAIGLSSDGQTLYLGGRDFTNIGGQVRSYFAEIDATTGLATSFYPTLSSYVYAIGVADGQVLIGGSFGTESVARSEVAAIDLTTYELTDFDPDVVPYNDNTTYALALSPDGDTLYIGGSISGVNGGDAPRSMLAAVSTDTGLATEFDPDLDSQVYVLAVSPDGTTVYAGGEFGDVNGGDTYQPYLASFDAITGAVDESFVPELDGSVAALALSSDGQTLYTAGSFTSGILALDATTGETLITPGASPNNSVYALDLSSDDTTLYVGGNFDAFEADSVAVGEGFVADADTGTTVGSPNILSTNQSTVYTSISDGNGGWYVGGSFNRINGEVWNSRIVHILPNNVIDTNFEPDFGGESGEVYALALDDDGTLYAGGQFLNLGVDDERVGLAAFDTSDGSLLPFDPSLGVYNDGALVRALELDGNGTLYVGGQFTCVGYDYGGDACPEGSTRNNLAAIDTETGLATAFDPNISGATGVYDIDISADGSVLYVGGGFTTVNGDQPRTDFAAFSLELETLGDVTALAPDINGVPETVHAIAESSDGSIVYVGGSFYTTVDLSQVYTILAAIDVDADGGVGAFSEMFPSVLGDDGEVVHTLALSSDDGTLYVGGYLWDQGVGAYALSTQDGSIVNGFDVQLDDYYTVYTIGAPQNGEIFIGGESMYLLGEGGGARQGLAALDTTDLSLTDFDPNIEFLSVNSLAVSSDDEVIYVGGNQDGAVFLASFDADGAETPFSSPLSASGYVYALALSPEDDELYAGGEGFEGNYAIFSSVSEEAEEPPVEEENNNGGGGSSSRRHTTTPAVPGGTQEDAIKMILEQLIPILQQLIQELLAQQQN